MARRSLYIGELRTAAKRREPVEVVPIRGDLRARFAPVDGVGDRVKQPRRSIRRVRAERADRLHRVDPAVGLVDDRHQGIQHGPVQRTAALARCIQSSLCGMERLLGGRHIEQGDRSLERMRRAEQRVERGPVFRVPAESDKRAMRLRHQIAAFDQELF